MKELEAIMNNLFYGILLPMLITITPFEFNYYHDNKSNVKKAIVWGIISFIVCLFITIIDFNNLRLDISRIRLTTTIIISISTIISTLFNIGLVKEIVNAKKVMKLLLVLSLFFFIQLTQYIPIKLFNLDSHNLSSKEQTYLTLFSDSILLIILVFIYRKELKEQFNEFKKNFYSFIDTGFKYWLIGLIVMVVSNLLINAFSSAVAGNENSVQSLIHGAPFASIICIGMLAPFIEEMTFRKAFYDTFSKKWVFVLVSAFVFGSLHIIFSYQSLWDFLYLIPYCSLGVAFGCTMVKTKNIFPSILIHMFHNTCLTILSITSSLAIIRMLPW